MAVLTHVDLVKPNGWVKVGYFPDEDAASLNADLDAWLAIAYAEPKVIALTTDAEKNKAARSYAYARAVETILDGMNSDPLSVTSSDQGAKTWSKDQIAYWQGKYAEFTKEWDDVGKEPEILVEELPPTTSLDTIPTWGRR